MLIETVGRAAKKLFMANKQWRNKLVGVFLLKRGKPPLDRRTWRPLTPPHVKNYADYRMTINPT
jgi:hypothetical protein